MTRDPVRAAIIQVLLVAAIVFALSASGAYLLLTQTRGS